MSARRYSAGKIFLDVIPSFRNVVREVEREAQKVRKSLAEDNAEAVKDDEQRQGEVRTRERVKAERKAGDAQLTEAQRAWQKMSREERREAAVRERARIRNERLEARRSLEGEVAKLDRIARANREAQAALEKLREEAARRERKRQKEVADAQRKAREDMAKEAELAEKRLAAQRLAMAEKAQRDLVQMERQAARERQAIDRAAQKEWETTFAAEMRAREKEVARAAKMQGGRFGQEMRKALTDALKDVDEVKVNADASGAMAEVAALRARMEALRDKKIGIDVTGREAMAEMMLIERMASRLDRRGVDIDVRTNAKGVTAILREQIDTMRAAGRASADLGNRHRQGRDEARDAANAFRLFNFVILAATLAIPMLVPAIAGLAAGLGSLIPLALGAGAGLGALIFGLTGVAPAVQALGDAQDNAAKDALAYEKTMRSAGRAVRDAQQGIYDAEQRAAEAASDSARRVQDARRNVAEATERGAQQVQTALRRVKDAEDDLADAQRDSARAQRDLLQAREDAEDQMRDMALRAAGGALAERQARLDLKRAEEEYRKIVGSSSSTAPEKEQASIDFERAKLQLEQSISDNQQLQEEQREAAKNGIEGSDLVVAAKERVADATKAEQDAERSLADAQQGVADARIEAAQAVTDAQRGLADALRDQQRSQADSARAMRDAQERLSDAQAAYQEALTKTGDIGSSSMQKLEEAMGALGPEGQEFARFLHSLREPIVRLRNEVQRGLLPGVQEFMQDMMDVYGPGFTRWLGEIGIVLGDVFRTMSAVFQGDIMSSFFATMDRYAGTFTTQTADIIFNLLELVGGLATAFALFGVAFGDALVRITEGWANWAAALGESDGFYRFMEYAERAGGHVVTMLVALGEALINLGVGLAPYADMLVMWATNFFDYLADMDPDMLGKIAAGLVTLVVGLQLAAGAMALFSGASMFFAKDKGGGFANPLALAVLALTAMVGIGAILANEFEWFADAAAWLGEKLQELYAWGMENRKWLALAAFAAGVAYAAFQVLSTIFPFLTFGVKGLVGALKLLRVVGLAAFGWAGLIIVVIAALVVGIIHLWRTNEGFRDALIGVWRNIRGAVEDVVVWFRDTAIPAMVTAWDWLMGALQWAWENIGAPIWRELVRVASWAADLFVRQILPVIGDAFRILWGVVKLIFMWIGRTFGNAVDDWRNNSSFMRTALEGLWGFVVDFYENGIRPTFEAIGDVIVWWWEKVVRPIFRKVADAIDTMVAAFESGEGLISSIWAGIVEGISGPVNVVIRWINDKMIGNLNKLLADVGLSWKIPEIPNVSVPFYARRERGLQSRGSGGRAGSSTVRGAYATGGVMDVLPGYSPGVDNFLFTSPIGSVALGGGEGILRPEVTAVLGADWIRAINDAAMAGGQGGVSRMLGGYATGGVVDFDRLPRNKTAAARELQKPPQGMSLWELFTTIKEIVENPVKGVRGFIDDLIDYMPGRDTFGGRWLGGAMLKMGGTVGEKIKEFFTAPPSGGGGGGGGGGRPTQDMAWPMIWAMVKRVAPEAVMTSNFRSGARTAGYGNTSLHALGRAIDVVSPNMATTFMKILRGMPWPNELIHTPMGNLQIARGGRQTGNFAPITRAQHYDHIHLGYDRGGIFPDLKGAMFGGGPVGDSPMPVNLFDDGGMIDHGSLGLNLSGKPEAVLTNEEYLMLKELASSRGSVTYAPELTSINGASAREVLDEMGWEVNRLEREHRTARGR